MTIVRGTLKQVSYPPERLADGLVTTIGGGGGTVSPAPLYLNSIRETGWMVRLVDLATTQTAGMTVQILADGRNLPDNAASPATSQLAPNVPDSWAITATDLLSLQFQNTGAGAANNWQADWGLWVWRPTTLDKLRHGLTLEAADQELLHSGILPEGYTPGTYPARIIQEEYTNPQLFPIAGTANVPASSSYVTIARTTPPAGWFDVLEGISIDTSVGGTRTLAQQVADGVMINVDRDDSSGPLQTWPAYALQWQQPAGVIRTQQLFIPGRKQLRVYLTATAAVNNVPYRVLVRRYKEEQVHRVRWGLEEGSPQLAAMVRAGVL